MDLEGLERAAGASTPSTGDSTPPTGGVGSPTEDAVDEVEALCYAGESVVEVVSLSGGTVGVTSHRVLALTPDGDGPNLRAVDRPNVASVELSAGGDAGHGSRALRYGVYALALVGASFVVDFGSVSAVEPPSAPGAGEVVRLAASLVGMLTLVDDVLRYAGLGVLVVALLFAALYGYSRDSYLEVGVAGGAAVRVPATPSESAAADRLQVALAESSEPTGGPTASTGAAPTTSVEKASNPSDG